MTQLLGYWLRQSDFNVSYVKTRVSDLNCQRINAGLGAELDETVVVHHLKGSTAHAYVWGLLRHGVSHSRENCSAWTRVPASGIGMLGKKPRAADRSGGRSQRTRR